MNNLELNKWIKISIVAGVLLVSFSILFYFAIFLPQQEQLKVKRQKEQPEAEEYKYKDRKSYSDIDGHWIGLLETCLSEADNTYATMRADECRAIGQDKDCRLPRVTVILLEDIWNENRDKCYKRYPSEK